MNQHKSYVEGFGPRDYRRYRIIDREMGYWDGSDWNRDAAKARLFYTWANAAREYGLIQAHRNIGQPTKAYRAPVSVLVGGNEQMNAAELTDHLTEVSKLHGQRPGEQSDRLPAQLRA